MASLNHMNRYREVAGTLARHGLGFIIGGQLLSTRPDLLPPENVAELARLQADALRAARFSTTASVRKTGTGRAGRDHM